MSGVEAYILGSFSQPKYSKPLFNPPSSLPLHKREVAHKRYLILPSLESLALHLSTQNHAQSVCLLAKHSFINRKCPNISNSNSSRDIWHLAKNILYNFTSSSFPPLFHANGTTAITSVSKVELSRKLTLHARMSHSG